MGDTDTTISDNEVFSFVPCLMTWNLFGDAPQGTLVITERQSWNA